MSVYVRNLIINTHSDFSEDLELSQLAGKPTNLTGHTGASQMRKHPGSTTGVTTFTSTIASAAGGVITIGLSTTQTASLKPGRYVYDVLLTDDDGIRDRVVEGMVIVSQGATR